MKGTLEASEPMPTDRAPERLLDGRRPQLFMAPCVIQFWSGQRLWGADIESASFW
jgi:hypothetical protein